MGRAWVSRLSASQKVDRNCADADARTFIYGANPDTHDDKKCVFVLGNLEHHQVGNGARSSYIL